MRRNEERAEERKKDTIFFLEKIGKEKGGGRDGERGRAEEEKR